MNLYVIGGGAAGMLCAITSARQGADVVVIEKNEKLGKKIYITGKGRCNVTNCSGFDDYMNNIISNKKFLFAALKSFDSESCMNFFENLGVRLKIERGNRVFPVSDKSSDIIKALQNEIKRLGISVKYNEKVVDVVTDNNLIVKIVTDKSTYFPDKVVLATGGLSYPATGSTGDGLRIAERLGHTVVTPVSGLSEILLEKALTSRGEFVSISDLPKLEGLSLKNVNVKIMDKTTKKVIFEEFGEMLFTAKGVSGPIILTLSSKINRLNPKNLLLSIDLKPALSEHTLDERIQRDFNENKNKQLKNSLNGLLPFSLISPIIVLSGISKDKTVNSILKEERAALLRQLKGLTFDIKGLGDISSAIITAGGVSVKEINPKTMQSKLISNLYFAGEMIDIDALTGGFNLQLAFSTGYCAGIHINE